MLYLKREVVDPFVLASGVPERRTHEKDIQPPKENNQVSFQERSPKV